MSLNVKSLSFLGACLLFCGCASHEFHPYVGQQQKWPTSPGAFVDSQYAVPVYYGYPAQPYTVIGYLEETNHGRFSNAVKDAANSAKQLGADAVLLESHGKSSEPIGALTNATITPSGGNATVTGTTIIAHRHTDRATVVLIKWHGSDRGEIEAGRHN
jgi:hypothetical protein